jgi:2-polyprenyl-3-methyl-5-hydroxy-6-metoxy-1,4-benzoquinol methylase
MDHDSRIAQSWLDNADAWVTSVREGLIASRRAGTDTAIIEAVLDQAPEKVLDAGCGEGWLAYALSERGLQVTGFDGSAGLIDRARERGGAEYLHITYDAFIADPTSAGRNYDVVVFNFSLFTEDIVPVLSAAKAVLREGGGVVIQTVHPFNDAQGEPYVDGWREETFSSMSAAFRTSMPWYFRTMRSWLSSVRRAGYEIADVREPVDSESGRPLSLIVVGAKRAAS